MIKKNHGHIVTVASMAGYISIYGLADYCASKSAVVSLHESLFLELRKENSAIKTTLVCPFHMRTDLFREFELRLLPTVEPEYAADEIISAIRTNEEMAVIPGYLSFTVALKGIFPVSAATKGIEMFNGFTAMNKIIRADGKRNQLIQ